MPRAWGADDVGSQGVLDTIAGCDPTQLNTDDFNRRVIVAHAQPGQGMFIAALRRQLRRRGLDVPFDEHDLIAEITQRLTRHEGAINDGWPS